MLAPQGIRRRGNDGIRRVRPRYYPRTGRGSSARALSLGMTIMAAWSSSIALVNALRSLTPASSRRSAVLISHSLRSTVRIAWASLLSRRFSSERSVLAISSDDRHRRHGRAPVQDHRHSDDEPDQRDRRRDDGGGQRIVRSWVFRSTPVSVRRPAEPITRSRTAGSNHSPCSRSVVEAMRYSPGGRFLTE